MKMINYVEECGHDNVITDEFFRFIVGRVMA
jgi:hypothetical protein